MKKFYFIVLLSIICVDTFAQEMYEITPEIAKKISQGTEYTYGTDFNLFNAEYQNVELPVFDTTLVETEKYIKLKQKIVQLEKDSIEMQAKYQKDLIVFNEQCTIILNIDSFLLSKDNYKISKEYLRNAQITANKYGFDYLIYADKTINKNKILDYSSNRSDSERFIFELNKINRNFKNSIRKPDEDTYTNTVKDLNSAKDDLEEMEINHLGYNAKYELNITQKGTEIKNILMKQDPVVDYSSLVGEFKMISDNNYCIIEAQNGFVKKQIISVDEVIKNKLDQYVEGYYSYSSYLFENIKTKELYYGESKFFGFCEQEYIMTVAVKKISDLGYGVSQVGNDTYINTKSIKLLFTNDIYKSLNTDKEYINRLASSVSSYLKYSEQFMPLTTEMANYYKKWSMGTIDNTGIQEWKSVIQKAQNLNEKLKNLEFNTIDNSYNYNKQLPSNVINNKLNFYTILNKSIELMGQ